MDISGELTDLPDPKYNKFVEKFKEAESLPVQSWKPVHIIGYFCKLYEAQYHTKYKLKFNTPQPSKCFEVFIIKRLSNNLSSDPVIIKDYLDWVFANRVKYAKRKLTSISFIVAEDLLAYYKTKVYGIVTSSTADINRSSPLPSTYKAVIHSEECPINSYGDLAFAYQSLQNMPKSFQESWAKLLALGFDPTILSKIL
jgi:hypothetical protein